MGQFFTTVNPNFIEDALYQSPLDLAEKLLSKRQERHDKFIEEVPLLGEAAKKVQYINDPIEREIVNRNLQAINDRVNDLTTKITNDPLNYNTYQKELNALKNDVGLNLTSGELSKVQASYNNYERVMKDNEKNPDKDLIIKKLLSNWQNDKGSLGKTFDYYKGVDKPDIEKITEKVKLDPDKYTMINGKFVDKITGVSMSDQAKLYQGAILSDPNYEAYVKHNEFLGRGGYDMSQTPMFAPSVEIQGRKYTEQEFEDLKRLNPDKTKEIEAMAKPALIPNPNSGWFGQGLIAEAKAYNQIEKEINPVWKEEAGLAMERAKLAETARSNKAREAQQKANLEFRKQASGLIDNPNVVSIISKTADIYGLATDATRGFAKEYGLKLEGNDDSSISKGLGPKIIKDKILASNYTNEEKNTLWRRYNDIQRDILSKSSIATNKEYEAFYGKEVANKISKYTTNFIKNGESAVANKPIIYNGKRYEGGLQDNNLYRDLGFYKKDDKGVETLEDKFSFNNKKVSQKMSDEDGDFNVSLNTKNTINPLSVRPAISNPSNLKASGNYMVMEATSDKDNKVITIYIPTDELSFIQ